MEKAVNNITAFIFMSKQHNIAQFNKILEECEYYDFTNTTHIVSSIPKVVQNKQLPNIEFNTDIDNIITNSTIHVFASGRRAGGGVVNGANAQEEYISRKSSWYVQASQQPDFYVNNTGLHKNDCIVATNGYWFVDRYNNILDAPLNVNFAGICAPINFKISDIALHNIFIDRWRILLYESRKISNTLITGAWGTGVFGNKPEVVASALAHAILSVNTPVNIILNINDIEKLIIFKQYLTPGFIL